MIILQPYLFVSDVLERGQYYYCARLDKTFFVKRDYGGRKIVLEEKGNPNNQIFISREHLAKHYTLQGKVMTA